MGDRAFARSLLDLAERDFRAMKLLATGAGIDDSVVGFHAQQTVEKALKAVLAHAAVAFRRTHDIAELLDLLADSGQVPPPAADFLDELTPYAVNYRYGLIEPRGLDRPAALAAIEAVLRWAQAAIGDPTS
jgi:HEPN domain-containing protein